MKIENPGVPLTESDLEQFEARHQITLPDDYREFMLKHNGGMPWLVYFKSSNGRNYDLTKLYSIGCDSPFDLDNKVICNDWPQAYREGTIVIGRDSGGSQFLMATRGNEVGTIYFLNREPTLRPKGRVARIASSFYEMMENLHPLFEPGELESLRRKPKKK